MTHEPNCRNPSGCSGLTSSLSRGICGSLSRTQISPYGETSHIPGTLGEMPFWITKLRKCNEKVHYKQMEKNMLNLRIEVLK